MIEIEEKLENLKRTITSSSKEKILNISTTADINNPPFILGSIRETNTTISGTIILRNESFLDQVIEKFDGIVDYFFVDSEVKNELKNLEMLVFGKVKKSKIFVCKPNDFTVESLDTFVALLFTSLRNKKALVLGAGNIGSKIALKLCERGAEVFLHDTDIEKAKKISEGLSLIKRSQFGISVAKNPISSAKDCDVIIGCTPGIPVVSMEMVKVMSKNGKIIDAGNRTIIPEALAYAREIGIEVLSLSSLGGYRGMIENWLFQKEMLSKIRIRSLEKWSLIIPGVLGKKGDILVDDVEHPTRVFGVCDGEGTFLSKDEGQSLIRNYVAEGEELVNIQVIEKLYQ